MGARHMGRRRTLRARAPQQGEPRPLPLRAGPVPLPSGEEAPQVGTKASAQGGAHRGWEQRRADRLRRRRRRGRRISAVTPWKIHPGPAASPSRTATEDPDLTLPMRLPPVPQGRAARRQRCAASGRPARQSHRAAARHSDRDAQPCVPTPSARPRRAVQDGLRPAAGQAREARAGPYRPTCAREREKRTADSLLRPATPDSGRGKGLE